MSVVEVSLWAVVVVLAVEAEKACGVVVEVDCERCVWVLALVRGSARWRIERGRVVWVDSRFERRLLGDACVAMFARVTRNDFELGSDVLASALAVKVVCRRVSASLEKMRPECDYVNNAKTAKSLIRARATASRI